MTITSTRQTQQPKSGLRQRLKEAIAVAAETHAAVEKHSAAVMAMRRNVLAAKRDLEKAQAAIAEAMEEEAAEWRRLRRADRRSQHPVQCVEHVMPNAVPAIASP
jgi:hypothetical protein